MEILKKVDWNVLNTYIDNNLIIANKHPEYDLWILNYSPKVQSKKFWDLYSESSRGLIIDTEGNILARCLKKFKNYEEYQPSEIDWSVDFEAFEKMDGSMIILFFYEVKMEWIVASRGSFISEQSIEARKLLNDNIYNVLNKKTTYVLEYIAPDNRIVVDYGDRRELILLTSIITSTGEEIPYNTLLSLYSKYFTIVKRLNLKTFKDVMEYQKSNLDNEEGAVIRFSNGMRIKIKFSEYVRLHGIVTNVSNLVIWEHLKNKYDFNALLDRVPDEFYQWVEKTVAVLQKEFSDIERLALKEFFRIYHVNNITERKEFAGEALKSDMRSILFKLYDKKPYDEIIWKLVRPVYSKPFSKNIESDSGDTELDEN